MALGDPLALGVEERRRREEAFNPFMNVLGMLVQQEQKEQERQFEREAIETKADLDLRNRLEELKKRAELEKEPEEKERLLKEKTLLWETIEQRTKLHQLLRRQLNELYKKYKNRPEEALRDFEQDKDLWVDLFSPLWGERTEEMLRKQIQSLSEEKRPTVSPLAKRLFPTTTLPPTAGIAERGGEVLGKGLGGLLGYAGTLPSRTIGAGGELYNILGGATRGLTGLPITGIPQPYLDVMSSGKLFDIPTATNFYANLLRSIMPGRSKPR